MNQGLSAEEHCSSYQYGVPTNELAGASRAADPKSAGKERQNQNECYLLI